MKSFCIKTNNKEIINYLLKNIEDSDFENIYFISRKFKNYENVIIHYIGTSTSLFISFISELLTNCIILFYEPNLLRKIINFDYFYFDVCEKNLISKICFDSILLDEESNFKYRKQEIEIALISYLMENKFMILDGFVAFRLHNYNDTLREIVDYSVNKYIVEKEYVEFINLLKIYINSKKCESNLVHLIYTNGESILLDEKRNVISIYDSIFDAKYLSDISFSSNDYALNALITLLPSKIEIHLIGYEDEFINTLKLIFENRISICTDCNICKTYRILNNVPRA